MVEPPRTSRLVGLPLAVMAVALLGGGLVGVGVGTLALGASSGEGFADLGAFLLGMFAAVAVVAVAWLIGIVVLVRRLFPAGRRLLPLALTLGTMLAGTAVWTVAMAVIDEADGLGRVLLVVGQLVVLAAGPLGFWTAARVQRSGDVRAVGA